MSTSEFQRHPKRQRPTRSETAPPQNTEQSVKEEKSEALADVIEEIPHHVIYLILQALPYEEVAKTSFLSRKWLQLWRKFPVVDVNDNRWEETEEGDRRLAFIESIRTILSTHDLTDGLEKLLVKTAAPIGKNLPVLDELVAFALTGKAKVISLCATVDPEISTIDDYYMIPEILFWNTAPSLGEIKLEGCQFEGLNSVRLKALRHLTLTDVLISDEKLFIVVSGCPLLETLVLANCHGLTKPEIVSSTLQGLELQACTDLEEVRLNTSNLDCFTYGGNLKPYKVSCGRCPLLAHLHATHVVLERGAFESMLSSFPNLESISLYNCHLTVAPQMTFKKLRTVDLLDCTVEEEVAIVAPKLQTFQLCCYTGMAAFRPYSTMQFKGLRNLSLGANIYITDEILQNAISCLSKLETLDLSYCSGFRHLRVFSDSLTCLIVDTCPDLIDGEIVAPNLMFFEYVGHIVEFSRINASQHMEAHLVVSANNLYLRLSEYFLLRQLANLLPKFLHMKHIEFVKERKEIFPEMDNISEQLLQVTINFSHTKFGGVLARLLETSLFPETLSVNLDSIKMMLKFEYVDKRGGRPPSTLHDCLRYYLKEVVLEKFDGGSEQTQILAFLLHEAQFLVHVAISFQRTYTTADRVNLERVIRSYGKASEFAVIEFPPTMPN